MFNFFKKEIPGPGDLTLEDVVKKGLLTREEMLKIKKDRAIKEWENEKGPGPRESEERSHHRQTLDRDS